MSIRQAIQDGIKEAMKNKDHDRLECLRMAKAALLLKEKEAARTEELSDSDAIAALRGEIRKRHQSIEAFLQVNQAEEARKLGIEIAVLEEYLPKQLSADDIEAKVREYLAAHPEMNHAGKLTGAMKKELGDLADGKVLNEVCRNVLGQ